MSKLLCCVFVFSFLFVGLAFAELNLDGLSPSDVNQVKTVLGELEPLIRERDEKHNLASLAFSELYAPLTESQKIFLKQFETLDANAISVKIPYLGIAQGNEEFVIITGQKIKIKGEPYILPPQFLPKDVNESYTKMMDAMQKEIGKRLYVESAYRSSAYQLYLFVFYLSNHDYSIRETVKYVALPGYSEHGCPRRQALDFINEDGINGDGCPEKFEVLPEYVWLMKNAQRFNFILSYPKDSSAGITYEPWHWRIKEKNSTQTNQQ
ncbi:MAG: M15 family metallopeptidase [Planctomycetaceae bacterium]|nr:M15 family metallopeptidase [Planctomycetaceae bacterium]